MGDGGAAPKRRAGLLRRTVAAAAWAAASVALAVLAVAVLRPADVALVRSLLGLAVLAVVAGSLLLLASGNHDRVHWLSDTTKPADRVNQ